MNCEQCGAENSGQGRFCSECGAVLPGEQVLAPTRECPWCGTENQTGSFCDACGQEIADLARTGREARAEAEAMVRAEEAMQQAENPEGDSVEMAGPSTGLEMKDIVVEVQTSKRLIEGDYGTFCLRVTNVSNKEWHIAVSSRISVLEQVDQQTKTHLLYSDARQEEYKFQLRATASGEFYVKTLKIKLTDPSNPKDVKVYCLPNDGIALLVRRRGETAVGGVHINGGITINVKDVYGSEVEKMVNLASERRGESTMERPHWQAIRMLFDPEATMRAMQSAQDGLDPCSETRRGIELVVPRKLPRQKCNAGVIVMDKPVHKHFFVLAKSEVLMGREVGDASHGPMKDIVIRRLPCRSRQEDVHNWTANHRISRTHCRFALRNGDLFIEDCGGSGGTFIGKRKLRAREATLLPDSCQVGIAGQLQLEVRSFDPAEPVEVFQTRYDRVVVVTDGSGDKRQIGMESACPVDCCRIRRIGNAEEHEYLLLFRQALIGNHPDNPIYVPAKGVEPFHAHLLYFDGEIFIRKASDSAPVRVDGRKLDCYEIAPLVPGAKIGLGSVELTFYDLDVSLFKHL